KPLHLAVHPSGKILAVQAKKKVYLVNIDIKSPLKGNKNIVVSSTNDYALEDEGGIAFRTDGKVLYFTDKHSKWLHIYELEYGFNSDNTIKWDNTTPSTLTSKHASINFSDYGGEFSNIVAANDGNIYIGENSSKIIFNYPMYSLIENNNSYHTIHVVKVDKKIKSIDVSNDGKYLLYVPKEHTSNKSLVRIYNTTTGEEVKTIEAAKELSYGIFTTLSNKDFSITDGSLFAVLTEKKKEDGNGAGVQVFGLDNKQWFELQNTQIEENGRIIQSPYDSKVIFTSKMKKGNGPGPGPKPGSGPGKDLTNLYFSDFLYSTADHNLTDEEAMVLNEEKGIAAVHADLAVKKHDILAVANDDNNNSIDLYDLNTLSKIDDVDLSAPAKLKGLSLNPNGDLLLGYYDNQRKGYTRFHLSDYSNKDVDSISYSTRMIFDDRVPNMVFSLENDGNHAFYNIDKDDSTMASNWEPGLSSTYDRKDFDLEAAWQRLDMIGMPNGGALVLFGKTDGSSMLEWIGRRNWAQDSTDKKGKYRLFARWTNIYRENPAVLVLPVDSIFSSISGSHYNTNGGRIVMLVADKFEAGVVIDKIKYKSVPFSDDRYITPIIAQYINGSKFKIVDYAIDSIKLYSNQSTGKESDSIQWANGGKIYSNCYVGFWEGNINGSSCLGAIKYNNEGEASSVFISDFEKASNLANELSANDIKNKEHFAHNSSTTGVYNLTTTGGYRRNYSIQFIAKNLPDSSIKFPPLGAKKIAITPNQSMLAILATDSSDIPYIDLYDFNNQIYDQETQIEGLLLDYRKQKQSGVNQGTTTDYAKLENPWPEENIDKPLFEEVEDNCHFGDGINTFGEATTKHDSWTSFNEHPCNYSSTYSENSSNKKGWANKRFIGYIRPETDINYMQMYFSDEPRIFCNKSFFYGTLERGPLSLIDNALSLNWISYSSNLFQLDYASNQGNMDISVFFNTKNNSTMANPVTTGNNAMSKYYYIYNNSDVTNGWIPLNSSDTYILNNHPSFMASFKAKIEPSTQLNITNTSMVFSRDRAKPVLYLTGSTYLWALYKNSLIRARQTDNGSIKGNLAISTNGQNLLYGTISGGKNLIRVVNIANPDENKFSNTSITTKEENVSAFSDSYLNIVKDLPVDSAPSYLVTKPFNSYSSEEVIGKYELLIATTSFNVSTNAAAVASGGIYIVNDASSTILVYNPITGSGTVKIKNDVLKKNANSVAVTAYDDTIYLFGNAGNGSDDAISGRVQCYDVSSRNSLSSKQRSGDSYRASIYSSAGNTYVVIEGSDNGISDKKNAFMNNSSDWIDDESSSNISYSYFLGKPFVVNKIYINNDAEWGGSFNVGVKDFRFVGVNGTNEKELCRGSLSNPEAKEFCFA
ncbi:MAG: hypothetical protein II567_02405, partial [Candidatus Riflebacteria bacterium]|nr:hypothetical protein [Candidatus Riflebacteria bacterium]